MKGFFKRWVKMQLSHFLWGEFPVIVIFIFAMLALAYFPDLAGWAIAIFAILITFIIFKYL